MMEQLSTHTNEQREPVLMSTPLPRVEKSAEAQTDPIYIAPELRKKPGLTLELQRREKDLPSPKPRAPWYVRLWQAMARAELAISQYLMINITSFIAFILYRILNHTRVYGRKNIGFDKNTLLLANHRTMIDSYLIGHLSSWPLGHLFPWILPYHPAAKENFFRNKIIGWFSKRWRCIPVRRGVRDFEALNLMTETLPTGQMVIFPEGTRSRTGELLKGRPGTGKLIKDTRCKCIPVYVQGMDKVLPVGAAWPRLFKKIRVIFGEPIDMSDLLDRPDGLETSQQIIDRVMEQIGRLKDELQAIEANRPSFWVAARSLLRRIFMLPIYLVRRLMAIVR